MWEGITALLVLVAALGKWWLSASQQAKRDEGKRHEANQEVREAIANRDADSVSMQLDRLREKARGLPGRGQPGVSGDDGATSAD